MQIGNEKYFNKSYLLCLFTEKSQLSAVSKQFVDLFSHALTYRSRHQSAAANTADVETAEAAIISAFLLVTLRYTTYPSEFRIYGILKFFGLPDQDPLPFIICTRSRSFHLLVKLAACNAKLIFDDFLSSHKLQLILKGRDQ